MLFPFDTGLDDAVASPETRDTMPTDPYDSLLDASPYEDAKKSPVTGGTVVLLDVKYEDDRGLELIAPLSRAVQRREVHEILLTDEDDPRSDGVVDRAAVFGFVEIERGGVVAVGDEFAVGDRALGTVVGFDETHAPNHLNVVIRSDDFRTGIEMDVPLGTTVTFG